MSVRVLSERLIKAGMEEKVVGLMQKMRSAAIFSRGFVSAEAVREVSQPQRYVIWSTWHHMDDWMRWLHESNRSAIVKDMEQCLEGPATHRIFRTSSEKYEYVH
eukprot:TRINITY_DN3158_c0_g1_i1.p2 TRINITY_DN3158_c0_g1~~TRINITY_DN3158_c0_g1_i1.p2  ORF type:complete len:104 (-),score=18.89 TRINITY_DN3158_c0_g1_i1:195-506(-)